MTRLWKTHHLLGAGSLLLLMAHPLLLALSASAEGPRAALALLFPPPAEWIIWAGWCALVLMMVFLAPGFEFFGRPRYERWKRLHRLAAPAALLALVHAWPSGSLLPAPAYHLLLIALGLAAAASFAWHFGLVRKLGRLRYRVDRVIAVANNVVELVLAPERGRTLDHAPGQFVYLTPHDPSLAAGRGEEHPYTITSTPGSPGLRVVIKDLGDATHAIQSIRPGSAVSVEGPFGCFFESSGTRPELWIAGGIGIAPFLARARDLATTGTDADISLIYCVQDEARARFRQELESIADMREGLAVHMHYFYRNGPLSRDFIDRVCPDAADREAFICGPEPLNALATRLLRAGGLPRDRIHYEAFDLL